MADAERIKIARERGGDAVFVGWVGGGRPPCGCATFLRRAGDACLKVASPSRRQCKQVQ